MEIDNDKLNELARTLTDDQRRLLREGLAGGGEVDPKSLAQSLRSLDTEAIFKLLAEDGPSLPPLKFEQAGRTPAAGHGEPVVVRVDKPSVTLAEASRLAKQHSGRELTTVSEVRVLDLDPSEVTEPILTQLASHELTPASAKARRFVKVEKPSMSTSLGELTKGQQEEAGAAAARVVVVVVVVGPIVIIIIFEPPDGPPPEPPLTRW